MIGKLFIVLSLLCGTPIVFSTTKKQLLRLQTDPLSKTRCDLLCFDVSKDNKAQCRSQCRTGGSKPGNCPTTDTPKWAAACVEACTSDSQCDGTQRCCRHGCTSSCDEPVDLLTLPGLPPLPTVDEINERKRSISVRWSDGVGDVARAVPGRVLYLLQEQHHVGPKYEEARLGDWNLVVRTNKTKASLRDVLKSGRWYRFRVASVSAVGSRGFSRPSAPFTPRRGPRPPPPPKKLRVQPLRSQNGSVSVRLEWREPKSDLPIMRYKVFWSRRVRGLGEELNSVLVNYQTVPKEKTYIEINDLLPHSMYFLQVQTITRYGAGKLRSEKAAVFYNTTNNNNINSAPSSERPPESLRRREKNPIRGLKLQKIIWYNNKLKARISWDPMTNAGDSPKRYFIHWRTDKCENSQIPAKDLLATTEKTVFEIYELDYHCIYKVNVNKSTKPKSSDSELNITVPGCEYFKRRMKDTNLNCVT